MINFRYLDGDHYASVIPINAATTAAPHAISLLFFNFLKKCLKMVLFFFLFIIFIFDKRNTTIPAHLTSPGKPQKKEHYIEPPNDFEKLVMTSSGI